MEDFDFNEENINDGFNSKLEEWREQVMIQAIESNYAKIEKNGINPYHLRNMENSEIVNLQDTLNVMLKHFEDIEDFEKCIVIKKELDKVISSIKIDI